MIKEIKPYRLLVVEDNPGDFVLLKQYLKKSELPVEKILHAENMAAVHALVKNEDFDIALLDLTLPDSEGTDSVITLNRLLPNTPIIVLSGLSTIEIATESISLGAQDYLVKGEFDGRLLAKIVQYSIERKRTSEKLRESYQRFEYLNKATQDTIWEWDFKNDEVSYSPTLSTLFGYKINETISNYDWWKENIHVADKDRVVGKIAQRIKDQKTSWEDEYLFRCADGSYKHVFDRGYVLYNEAGEAYKMIGSMADITERKKLREELMAQQLKQKELIIEVTLLAQEKERNELGRELHDNINQILATVKMYIGLVRSGQKYEEDLLGKSYEYVNDAMEELRKLSHSLVAPSLGDLSLSEALQDLVHDTNLFKGLQVQLLIDENYKEKDKSKELMLYRIVQEQLNNITKHAKANTVVITIKKDNNNLFLSVADDGVGFDSTKKKKGIGLKNISSRVEFYSGKMNIISSPGEGCAMEVYIPA